MQAIRPFFADSYLRTFTFVGSSCVCVQVGKEAHRLGSLLYPVFLQMRAAAGTPRAAALVLQWRSLGDSKANCVIFAVSTVFFGSIAIYCVYARLTHEERRR